MILGLFFIQIHLVKTSPIPPKNFEANDISLESPCIKLFELGEKLGMAFPWVWPYLSRQYIITFTKLYLVPQGTEFFRFS